MNKVAKFLIPITILIISLFGYNIIANAERGGGTGGSGGGGSGEIGGTSSTYHDCGKSENRDAYFMELVYYDGKAKNTIASTVIMLSKNPSDNFKNAVQSFANSKATQKTLITAGSLYDLAAKINDRSIDVEKLEREGWIDKNLNPDKFVNDFGITISQITGKKHETPPGINKVGYRIFIQRLAAWCQDGKVTKAYPRKMAASEGWETANGEGDFLGAGAPASSQDDLWTKRHDVGVQNGNDYSWSKANFADWNIGIGYNIIWFPNKYAGGQDYSIDAACENCDSTNDKGSYLVQDTTDWASILASRNSDETKIRNYYRISVGDQKVYCREEYRVTFPNENNKITAEAGRFFTINKMGGDFYKNGVPNLKPIKVEKIKQCRTIPTGNFKNEDEKKAKENSTLSSYLNNMDSTSVAGGLGTIQLTYNENYAKSKYKNVTIKLQEDKNRTLNSSYYTDSVLEDSTKILTTKTTKYYKLPEDTYRWINIRDNVSSLNKPASNVIDHFLDVEVENLPISVNNYKTAANKGKAATVTLNYALPTTGSNMYKAFNPKNNYFQTSNSTTASNIYKRYVEGGLNTDEQTQIKQSACAKLYGYETDKFNTCVSERQTNKSGNCQAKITNSNNYVCDIDVCPEGEMLCDKNVCSTDGECPTNPKCQIVNDVYYGKNGTPVSAAQYAKDCPACKIENGKYYGQDGKEITKEEYLVECPNFCKIVDGKYYGKHGQIVTKAQYESECPDSFCTLCNGGKCCPDLDMVCPDEMGECPGRGNTIIYRTIDLKNPFPGQTNYKRQTGANWCSYNSTTGKINCKNTNNVATTHIQNNRKNKDESVYNLEPLYEVDLNATNMKAIRQYNREGDHKYDDFTLTCEKGTCQSLFLRDNLKDKKIGLNLKGVCNTSNYNDLRTCAERGR